jgi:hypothetical protein
MEGYGPRGDAPLPRAVGGHSARFHHAAHPGRSRHAGADGPCGFMGLTELLGSHLLPPSGVPVGPARRPTAGAWRACTPP